MLIELGPFERYWQSINLPFTTTLATIIAVALLFTGCDRHLAGNCNKPMLAAVSSSFYGACISAVICAKPCAHCTVGH
jgi:hypothetical protein